MNRRKTRFVAIIATVTTVLALGSCAMMEGLVQAVADSFYFTPAQSLNSWFSSLGDDADSVKDNAMIAHTFDPDSPAAEAAINPDTYRGTIMDPASSPKISDVKVEGNTATGSFTSDAAQGTHSFRATFTNAVEGETASDGSPREHWVITSFQIFSGSRPSGTPVFSM